MNDGQTIQQDGSDTKRTDGDKTEEMDLWRRAENHSIPASEKLVHVFWAATVLMFYFLGFKESSIINVLLLWFVSFSSSRHWRQQTQIDALRELLRNATARRYNVSGTTPDKSAR